MSSSTMQPDEPTQNDSCSCWTTTILVTFLCVYFILFRFKNPIQFYVKFATYVIIVMVYSVLLIPFAIFRPNNARNIEIVGKTMSFLFQIFCIRIEIENSKYFNLNQPYIIINNHQSSLDFITMMRIWPGGNCTPLAKKELLYSGPFGLAIWLCGITFIDRLNPEKSRGTIDQLADKINKENMRVWIYPEGTRSAKTELLPFKKGAFHLAIRAQIPIVCMVTSSYLNFYSKKEKKFLFGGRVKCRVLPPFQTKGMTLESVGHLTKHLQEEMQKEFDLLNKEINLEEKYYQLKSKNEKNQTKQEVSVNKSISESLNLDDSSFTSNLADQTSPNQSDKNNNSINNDEETKKSN